MRQVAVEESEGYELERQEHIDEWKAGEKALTALHKQRTGIEKEKNEIDAGIPFLEQKADKAGLRAESTQVEAMEVPCHILQTPTLTRL